MTRDTVLIVEDDGPIGGLLSLVVAQLAPNVVHVRSGEECLKWFGDNAASVAIVIMDFTLPDTHGGLLAHRMRALSPRVPLLLMSGRQQPDVVRLLAADGPTDFLAKPFKPGDVLGRLRALLAGQPAA